MFNVVFFLKLMQSTIFFFMSIVEKMSWTLSFQEQSPEDELNLVIPDFTKEEVNQLLRDDK